MLIPSRRHSSATVTSPRKPSRMMRIFSSPEYRLRLFRLILRTVLAADVVLLILAIVLSSHVFVTDGENLSYSWLLISPTVSDVKHCVLIWAYS